MRSNINSGPILCFLLGAMSSSFSYAQVIPEPFEHENMKIFQASTFLHVYHAPCDSIIPPSAWDGPRVLWTGSKEFGFNGLLINMIDSNSPNFSNRLLFFHWSVAEQMIMVFPNENIEMDKSLVTYRSAVNDVHSLFIFDSSGVVASVDFGAFHDTSSDREMDLVTCFRMQDGQPYECSTVMEPSRELSDGCLFDHGMEMNGLLERILERRRRSRSYEPSPIFNNPLVQRFFGRNQ